MGPSAGRGRAAARRPGRRGRMSLLRERLRIPAGEAGQEVMADQPSVRDVTGTGPPAGGAPPGRTGDLDRDGPGPVATAAARFPGVAPSHWRAESQTVAPGSDLGTPSLDGLAPPGPGPGRDRVALPFQVRSDTGPAP